MLGAVELIWLFLTSLVSFTGLISLVQPNWIINPLTAESFGPLSHCFNLRLEETTYQFKICSLQDINHIFVDYPSVTWQFLAVIYTMSTGLMMTNAAMGWLAVFAFEKDMREKIAAAASYTQWMASKCERFYGHILLVDNYLILSLKSTLELGNFRPVKYVLSKTYSKTSII